MPFYTNIQNTLSFYMYIFYMYVYMCMYVKMSIHAFFI